MEVELADVCRVSLEGPVDLRLGVPSERFVDQECRAEDDGEHHAEHRAHHEPSARDATNVAVPRPLQRRSFHADQKSKRHARNCSGSGSVSLLPGKSFPHGRWWPLVTRSAWMVGRSSAAWLDLPSARRLRRLVMCGFIARTHTKRRFHMGKGQNAKKGNLEQEPRGPRPAKEGNDRGR